MKIDFSKNMGLKINVRKVISNNQNLMRANCCGSDILHNWCYKTYLGDVV